MKLDLANLINLNIPNIREQIFFICLAGFGHRVATSKIHDRLF